MSKMSIANRISTAAVASSRRSRPSIQKNSYHKLFCSPQNQFAASHLTAHSRTIKTLRTTLFQPDLSQPSHAHAHAPPSPFQQQTRSFETEADFHDLADETLETIQDELDDLFENATTPVENGDEIEINYSSGVLTISLGANGTWVLNKQTPNRQIWWSSPLSGPQRFEHLRIEGEEGDGTDVWVSSRDPSSRLGALLSKELKELYGFEVEFNL